MYQIKMYATNDSENDKQVQTNKSWPNNSLPLSDTKKHLENAINTFSDNTHQELLDHLVLDSTTAMETLFSSTHYLAYI